MNVVERRTFAEILLVRGLIDDLNKTRDYEDIERFEDYLNGGSIGFLDSDRLEMLIDHYLINSQYNKANVCADHAISHFSPQFFSLTSSNCRTCPQR